MKFSVIVFLVVFLYWHLGFPARIWFGFILGFIVDSLNLLPFSTYTTSFILAAILIEVLRHVFSNTDSWFTKGIAVGSVFFLVNSAIYPFSYLLGRMQKNTVPWDSRFALDIIIWSLIPAAVIILFLSVVHFKYEVKKK